LRDRVCMTAAMLVLEPIFEADLPSELYAYRPGRNALSLRISRKRTVDLAFSPPASATMGALLGGQCRAASAENASIAFALQGGPSFASVPELQSLASFLDHLGHRDISPIRLTVNELQCLAPQTDVELMISTRGLALPAANAGFGR